MSDKTVTMTVDQVLGIMQVLRDVEYTLDQGSAVQPGSPEHQGVETMVSHLNCFMVENDLYSDANQSQLLKLR